MSHQKLFVIEGGKSLAERQLQQKTEFDQNIARACAYGDVSNLQQTLSDSRNQQYLAEMVQSNVGPCTAARNGHLGAVREILTHPSFLQYCDPGLVQYYMDEVFLYATLGEHTHVMEYLLEDPSLSVHAEIDAISKRAFFTACRGGRKAALEFFIVKRRLTVSPLDRLELMEDSAISEDTRAFIASLESTVSRVRPKSHLSLVA